MILYPNDMYDAIEHINIEDLKNKNIKGMILDIDNTLIDSNKVLSDDVKAWVNKVKQSGIQICILSNTNKRYKVERIANIFELPYFMFAIKPMRRGFKKCLGLLKLKPEEICVIGDQIFTDVWGGNRMGMYTIYTKPISPKDCSITTIVKRPFERIVVKKYLKEREMKNGSCN